MSPPPPEPRNCENRPLPDGPALRLLSCRFTLKHRRCCEAARRLLTSHDHNRQSAGDEAANGRWTSRTGLPWRSSSDDGHLSRDYRSVPG